MYFLKERLVVEVEDSSTGEYFSSRKIYKMEKKPQNVFIDLSKLNTQAN